MDDIIKVKHRGSFHVGGEKVKLENAPVEDFPYQGKFTFHSDPNGTHWAKQMYVQYTELRRLAPHSDTSFVLDTLEYMWKGGRCSGVAALGANMLKLKPCLEMREGKLVVCKKYRGSMDKVYRQYIAERLAGKAVVADHAFITHSGEVPEETLSQLTALVRELAPFEEVFVTQAGCTVSSHCGPGTLGVLFLRKA